MPYTLWSRGILIGATDFALGDRHGPHLAGIFQPTESGMLLLPALTAMAPALFDFNAMLRREKLSGRDIDEDPDRVFDIFEHSPEGRRVIASAREVEQLELRAPGGGVLAFQSILVSDLEELRRFGFRKPKKTKKGKRRKALRDPVRYLISATLATPVGTNVA